MINAFATHRNRYYDSRSANNNRPFRRGEKRKASSDFGSAETFRHEVDMSRVRPLTNEEWSRRLIGESRFAAWMGIYGIVIGVLLGWFVANLHVMAHSTPPAATPAPVVKPIASPVEDAADKAEGTEETPTPPQIDYSLI